ncbi:ABC transporter substrate-binding protein [Hamadaea tsunoensis]|uniref:ABC transporter substrate-binding protein n=1 Tax=Hamadaea tsunoensis TaxID=53368 RepID=UPI00048A0E44|nr:ABC transporter substrate-binding protein [Hamadaea tsunoensis]
MRRTWSVAAIGLLTVAVGAAGCTKNTGNDDTGSKGPQNNSKLVYVDDAKGPAPEIKDAKKGGILTVLNVQDFDHLEPQNTYVGAAIMVGNQLGLRTLTSYYEKDDGQIELMGDLATTTGQQTENCKVWTYKLRDNIKFEDGTAVTAKDIAYGVSRAFDESQADGPTYIQRWLAGEDFGKAYTGPFKNPGTIAPGITTPDDKTIVFTLQGSHCDFPLAAALPTTVPVLAAKDPGGGKMESPMSTGPYKIKSYTRGQRLEWVRNDNWDPTSDPLRHNYADGFVFDFSQSDPDIITKRLVADQGADQLAIGFPNPTSASLPDIQSNESAKKRVIEGDTIFSQIVSINTQRVTDVDIRRAMIYAYNKQAVLQIIGGATAGTPSTTLTPPVTPGYKKFDAYNVPLTGDPDKAKTLLQGKTLRPFKYCYRAGGVRPQVAAAVKEAFAKAGIEIVPTELDRTTFYSLIGKKGNDCDLAPTGWGQDYPSPTTVLGVLASGHEASHDGSNNNSWLDVPEVTSKLDELASNPDPASALPQYGDLEEKIMKDYAPWIPIYYVHSYTINGSKVGGIYLSQLWGSPSLQNAYVIQ